jgi:hypothetical protein
VSDLEIVAEAGQLEDIVLADAVGEQLVGKGGREALLPHLERRERKISSSSSIVR